VFAPLTSYLAMFTRADLVGVLTDLAVFYASLLLGAVPGHAQAGSFVAGTFVGFAIKTNRAQAGAASGPGWGRVGAGGLVALGAFFLRAGLLASLTQLLSLGPETAIVLPALLSAAVTAVGGTLFVFAPEGETLTREATWPRVAVVFIAYSLLLRLCYLGLPEILFEEGYYWNYAQHLDLGYLDHPPMVGWVIWLFTTIAGDSEFVLRLGAFLAWFVCASYCYKLTKKIFGAGTALDSVLLCAMLPTYVASSIVVLPDSFLVACWAGALYYLYLFLIEEKPTAFLGVGLFFGVGLLSKYTIALLSMAALAFVITDRRARKLLLRPEIYLAMVIAALLFSPDILWNARNHWASFVYQGPARAAGDFTFELHKLIGAVLVLITPTGLMAAGAIFLSRRSFLPPTPERSPEGSADKAERTYRLLLLSTGLPLAVFVAFSLFRQTKLNWTGPLWLGVLPYMAHLMSPLTDRFGSRLPVFGRRPWAITAVALGVIYGGALYYLTLGLPGVPYPTDLMGLGWREISRQVEGVAGEVEAQTGERPLVVGMDVNRISSWLAFYRGRSDPRATGLRTNSGAVDTGGRHLFGKDSYMYGFWFPSEDEHHKTMVLVARKPEDLKGPRVGTRIADGGEVREITAEKNGQVVRRVYYRVVTGYRGP